MVRSTLLLFFSSGGPQAPAALLVLAALKGISFYVFFWNCDYASNWILNLYGFRQDSTIILIDKVALFVHIGGVQCLIWKSRFSGIDFLDAFVVSLFSAKDIVL